MLNRLVHKPPHFIYRSPPQRVFQALESPFLIRFFHARVLRSSNLPIVNLHTTRLRSLVQYYPALRCVRPFKILSRLRSRLRIRKYKPRFKKKLRFPGRSAGAINGSTRRAKSAAKLVGPHKGINRTKYLALATWGGAKIRPSIAGDHLPEEGRRWIPPKNPLDELNQAWSLRFSCVANIESSIGRFRFRSQSRLEKYAGLNKSNRYIRYNFKALPPMYRLQKWQDTMLLCLQHSPQRAVKLLCATLDIRESIGFPRYIVAECLEHIATHYLHRINHRVQPWAFKALLRFTHYFIQSSSGDDGRAFEISQQLAFTVQQHCTDTQLLALFENLSSKNAILHVNTILHFIERFVDMGKMNSAIRLLDQISSTGFDLSADQIQSACVKMVRARYDIDHDRSDWTRNRVVTQILHLGIRPNMHLYNAILLNEVEASGFDTAWRMFLLFKHRELNVNSITYGILLKGAKLSGQFHGLEMLLHDAEENGTVFQDPRLVSDMLHGIYVLSPEGYPSMLEFYKRHCDLRPLQELGICGPETMLSPDADLEGLRPTQYILGQMLMAYNRLHQTSLGLIHTYELYLRFLQDKHPVIAPLAQNDYVANSFIMAFGRQAETLPHATRVVRHMLEGSKSSAKKSAKYPVAPPTVQTWNILAAAYLRNKQKYAAEKVVVIMREHGLKPDKVTWNTLVSGYAGMQNVTAAVGATKMMEAEGFETDKRTLEGLGRLKDRDQLFDAMTKSFEQQEKVKSAEETLRLEKASDERLDAVGRTGEALVQDRGRKHGGMRELRRRSQDTRTNMRSKKDFWGE